ncbi:MAG: hypothetical protein ACK40A_03590, partial [Pannonibacter indicus]
AVLLYVPAGHTEQAVAPLLLNVPARQLLHSTAAVWLPRWPALRLSITGQQRDGTSADSYGWHHRHG